MRLKLSYKIFVTLTLTLLLVVALMVGLIRFYVARKLPGQEIISTVYAVGYKFTPPSD